MNLKDMGRSLGNFWKEFRREKSGLVGLAILVISVFLVLFEPLVLPWADTNSKWRSIDYWQDNSPSSPPAWTSFFSKSKSPVTLRLAAPKVESADLDTGGKMLQFTFDYDFQGDNPPLDLIFHAEGIGNIPIAISVVRPDGKTIDLASRYDEGLTGQAIRLSADNDGRDAAFTFVKEFESEKAVESLNNSSLRATEVIFNKAQAGMGSDFVPLKGAYALVAKVMLSDPGFKIEKPAFVIQGSVSGILGTDDQKHDLYSGLLAGLKWALLIGLLTSAISVLIGVLYGIIAAYYGGVVDTVMMFIFQIVNSIPVLPVLIVVSAIFKPTIWFLIATMVIFFWTGSVMTVRSMALQIKEETYIEAAKALGAKNGRIILRHMLPLLIPYSFASMALSVPSAIVYESSVSLLGLGDATIVTWGQILHDAMQGAAFSNGLWWWILPPGLLIAIMGMTFAFLGFAMDKILHPKLKTR